MKAIRLDKAGDKLFEDSNFKNLVRYAKHASPQHPEKAMIKVLMDWYRLHPDMLYRILEAEKTGKYKETATELQQLLVKGWMKSNVEPGKILEYMDTFGNVDRMVANPFFWPGALEASLIVPERKDVAARLQEALIHSWDRANSDPSKVLEFMGIHNSLKNFILSPLRKKFELYLERYNAGIADHDKTEMIDVLLMNYTPSELNRWLQVSLTNPDEKEMATKLQKQQFQEWEYSLLDADDVFRVLDLHNTENEFDSLSDAGLQVWIKYIKYKTAKMMSGKAVDPGKSFDAAVEDAMVKAAVSVMLHELDMIRVHKMLTEAAVKSNKHYEMAVKMKKEFFELWGQNHDAEPHEVGKILKDSGFSKKEQSEYYLKYLNNNNKYKADRWEARREAREEGDKEKTISEDLSNEPNVGDKKKKISDPRKVDLSNELNVGDNGETTKIDEILKKRKDTQLDEQLKQKLDARKQQKLEAKALAIEKRNPTLGELFERNRHIDAT
ncbi:unnamed protein product [Peronospora belbahrii]|nr:unnamed protein product [Peronospora belbahrii]